MTRILPKRKLANSSPVRGNSMSKCRGMEAHGDVERCRGMVGRWGSTCRWEQTGLASRPSKDWGGGLQRTVTPFDAQLQGCWQRAFATKPLGPYPLHPHSFLKKLLEVCSTKQKNKPRKWKESCRKETLTGKEKSGMRSVHWAWKAAGTESSRVASQEETKNAPIHVPIGLTVAKCSLKGLYSSFG